MDEKALFTKFWTEESKTTRNVLARMAGQQARRPQLMRIAVVLGLVARQRHQPGFGLRRG